MHEAKAEVQQHRLKVQEVNRHKNILVLKYNEATEEVEKLNELLEEQRYTIRNISSLQHDV